MISLVKTQINTDIRIFMFSANSKKQSLIVKKPCAIIDYIWRIEFIILEHYVNIKMLFTTLQYPDKVNHQAGWMCQRPETHPHVLNKTRTYYKPAHFFPSVEMILLR